MNSRFAVRGAYIQLDQLLKAAALVDSGGAAHALVAAGEVRVDGVPETRKRAKLRPGQRVELGEVCIELVAGEPAGSASDGWAGPLVGAGGVQAASSSRSTKGRMPPWR